MNAVLTLASLAAVLAVVASAWFVRGPDDTRIADAAEATAMAEAMVSGFTAADTILCSDGRGAISEGADGSFVVLKRMGSRFAARRLRAPIALSTPDPCRLRIESGERLYGPVTLDFADEATLADWRARMAGGG